MTSPIRCARCQPTLWTSPHDRYGYAFVLAVHQANCPGDITRTVTRLPMTTDASDPDHTITDRRWAPNRLIKETA